MPHQLTQNPLQNELIWRKSVRYGSRGGVVRLVEGITLRRLPLGDESKRRIVVIQSVDYMRYRHVYIHRRPKHTYITTMDKELISGELM